MKLSTDHQPTTIYRIVISSRVASTIIARNLFSIQLSDSRIHLTLRSPTITGLSLVFVVIAILCIMLFATVKVGIDLSNSPDRNDN